ncbi:MAG: biopolymer transporter ExbD [Mariniblastus sp.]|nr:biopolymer transporter ExbD [Mariniblastus sp.]
MKLSKTKRSHSLGFSMTPMIDIVFLLIVFFLTVSQFSRDVQHPLSLAQVAQGAVAPVPTEVTINLDEDGIIFVSGEQLTLPGTIRRLQQELARNGDDALRFRIELRCDRRCPTDPVNQLIDRLADLGIRQVFVSVTDR